MFQFRFDKIWQRYRHLLGKEASTTQQPLLDSAALWELSLYAQSLPWSLIEFQRHTTHPLSGETLSFCRGRGFEFEENRAYQAGDDPRLLNWRLYARSGNLYTKVFSEERRPQVYLMVDRRAAMRFGTRRQLKVSLAVKLAACYIYQAQQQALAVGGLILNPTPEWFSPAVGEVPLQPFIQSLVSPCPPLGFETTQPAYEDCLQQLILRLPAGSFVLLISDFSDLNPDTATPLLHQLATRHTLNAIQILDPIEQRLPTSGDFLIEDTTSLQPLRIDGQDTLQQTHYTETCRDRQFRLAACFKYSGIPLKTCTTQYDVETCLGLPDANHNAH